MPRTQPNIELGASRVYFVPPMSTLERGLVLPSIEAGASTVYFVSPI